MGIKPAGVFALSEDDIDDPDVRQAGQPGMRMGHLCVEIPRASSLVQRCNAMRELKTWIHSLGSGPWFNSPQIHASSTRPPVDVSLCSPHSALILGAGSSRAEGIPVLQ